jgi:hypothetical protein
MMDFRHADNPTPFSNYPQTDELSRLRDENAALRQTIAGQTELLKTETVENFALREALRVITLRAEVMKASLEAVLKELEGK